MSHCFSAWRRAADKRGIACCSSSDKYGSICSGLWCLLQSRDLSGALTADRLQGMLRPVSAKVTRERWQPPPESSFTVTFTSALSGTTPKKAHRVQQSGPGGAAFVTPLLPLTPCIATACPAAFVGPRPVIWSELGIVWCLLPYYLRQKPETGGRRA